MATDAPRMVPGGCQLFPSPAPVLMLLLLLLWAAVADHEAVAAPGGLDVSPRAEVCDHDDLVDPGAACSRTPLQVGGSPSSVLLQRHSLVHADRGPRLERKPQPSNDPSGENVTKFLAGVPVYNYGYVKRMEECEQVDGSNCEYGLLQLGAEASRHPVLGLKEDWEHNLLSNDDEYRENKDMFGDDDDDDEEDRRAQHKLNSKDRVREWLVKMRDGVSDQVIYSFCERLPGNARCTAQGHPSEGGIPLIVVRSTEEELEVQLRNHQGKTDYVEPDIPMDAIPEVRSREEEDESSYAQPGAEDTPAAQESVSWGLDRIDDRHGLDGSYDIGPEGGQGVHVYIADTGIRTTHEDFHGRAVPTVEIRRGILRECEPSNHRCAQDSNGHGTHAAAIVGGRRYGVAKSSTLHSIKTLSKDGRGKMSSLIQALDWVATRGQKPAVFMSSVGGRGNPPSIQKAIEAASVAGVTVVVAAGNRGRDACEFSPAHVKAAITVGAIDDAADTVATYSNFGRCVDIYAPGSNIHSAGIMSDTAKATMSGTSMSTPHVAGALALLLGEDRTRTPEEVTLLLKARATQGLAKGVPGGLANIVLFTAPLEESDEIWWQSVWLPAWRKIFHFHSYGELFTPGPMKELMAEAFVCCLFLTTLGFMMTQCIRFFSLPADAYENNK